MGWTLVHFISNRLDIQLNGLMEITDDNDGRDTTTELIVFDPWWIQLSCGVDGTGHFVVLVVRVLESTNQC